MCNTCRSIVDATSTDCVRLGDIAFIEMGQSPDSGYVFERCGQYIPFLQGNAEFGAIYPTPLYCCAKPIKLAFENDILISVRAPVGAVNIAETTYCIGRGLAAIRCSSLPPTLLSYIISRETPELIKVAQGTTFEAINKNDLANLRFLLPDSEQIPLIARILDTLDTTIRETEAIIAKLKAVKQGLLHDLLTRGLDDNGELRPPQSEAPHLYKKSKLGWIPKEWGSRKIEDCLIQIVDGDRGKNYPSESEFTSGGYCLFLNAKNVTRDGFKFEETFFITESKDRTLGSGKLERNDIVITTRGTIGNFGFFDDSITFEHMRVNSGMLILRNQDASINSVFLFLSLKNYIFPFELQTKGSGSAQPQLPSKDLKTFHVLLPPIVEQIVLAEKIIKFEQRVASEEKALSKAIKLKSGLMDDLLTGRVRVTPLLNNLPNTSPEAAL